MNPETYAPKTARTLAVGANDAAAGWYGQGGLIGHLGRVPMVNAFGVLHDTWATRFGWSAISLPSQGTWVPALVVAESALLADAAASAMVTGAIRENNPR
jgi:hypothetical protein